MYKPRPRVYKGEEKKPGASNPEATQNVNADCPIIANCEGVGKVSLTFFAGNLEEAWYNMYEDNNGVRGKYICMVKYEINNSRWSFNNQELTIATGSKYLVRVDSKLF